MTDIRKNLIILIFVLSGVMVSLLVLNFQKLEKDQRSKLNIKSDALKNLPVKISRGPVDFLNLKDGSDRVLYYEETDSIIYEVGFDAKNKRELARISNVLKMSFSPNGEELIAAVSEKGILKNFYFNLRENRRVELPKNAENIVFSADGQRVVYYTYDKESDWVNILTANPIGIDPITIFKTRIKDLKLAWSETNLIILYPIRDPSAAFSITPDGKEFQKIPEKDSGETSILKNLGLETTNLKLSPLKDYLIFVNTKDKKLYSLKI